MYVLQEKKQQKVTIENLNDFAEEKPVNIQKDYVKRGWDICRSKDLKRSQRKTPKKFSGTELEQVLEINNKLILYAKPFMQSLYHFVKKTGFAVILTDSNSCILEVIGDKEIIEDSEDRDYFKKGTLWHEEFVGNTAINTAIREGVPIQISGEEHYYKGYKDWTCSAAPIKMDGIIIGVLDVRGYVWNSHPHTLAMVAATVKAIENQIVVEKAKEEILIKSKYQNAITECISDGFLTVDSQGILTYINETGAKILGINRDKSIGKHISSLLDFDPVILGVLKTGQGYVDREFMVRDKRTGVRYHFIKTAAPIRDEEGNIVGAVDNFRKIQRVHNMMRKLVGNYAKYTFDDIIGNSETIKECIRLGRIAARSSSNVLIYGESGTGKEMLVQSIHNESNRRNESLISINCAAIPSGLIESELFGYEGGAYTGALKKGQIGKFELASGGTLFLDEIGDMPLHMQAKLLRVLQENQFTRVGGRDIIEVDVRIICATNKDLIEECRKGNFREDLYYRLNVLNIFLPPLRERLEDIDLLVDHFIYKINEKIGSSIEGISLEALTFLKSLSWPGNIRQLENTIERAINICSGNIIEINDVSTNTVHKSHEKPIDIGMEKVQKDEIPIKSLDEIEKEVIEKALTLSEGNITQAAKLLKVSRNTIYNKIKRYEVHLNNC